MEEAVSEPRCTRCGTAYVARFPRPHRRYCTVSCRRDVEYEVRRLRRRMAREAAEVAHRERIDRWSGGLYSALRYLDGRTWLAETNGIRGEIRSVRTRLVLLGSRPTTKTTRTTTTTITTTRRAVPAPSSTFHHPGRKEMTR